MNRLSMLSRFCLCAVFVLTLVAVPKDGRAQSAEQQSAITAVIGNQLDAFRRNDGADAYGFAAPNIKTMFPTVDVFMSMVRRGYAILIDPAGVEFLDMRARDGALFQAVRLIGRDGERRIAIYQMEQQEDGSWKIAGVFMTEDPQAAV